MMWFPFNAPEAKPPTTWEGAAREAALELEHVGLGPDDEVLLEYISYSLVDAHEDRDDTELALGWFKEMGEFALLGVFNHSTNPNRLTELERIVSLIAKKQHSYGHGNINAFGLVGIIVRMTDKVARLRNLMSRDEAPQIAESIADSWDDLVGYSIIAIMVLNGTFDLPLSADLRSDGARQLPADVNPSYWRVARPDDPQPMIFPEHALRGDEQFPRNMPPIVASDPHDWEERQWAADMAASEDITIYLTPGNTYRLKVVDPNG